MEEDVSIGFVFAFIAIVVIILFIFAKPDNKKSMLNTIGLDLSESTYNTLKEREFAKKCLAALSNVSISLNGHYDDERFLLGRLIDELSVNIYDNNLYLTHVATHYVKFAWFVANRRYNELYSRKNCKPLINGNLNSIESRKRYVKILWEQYQYPWPKNWLQKEAF